MVREYSTNLAYTCLFQWLGGWVGGGRMSEWVSRGLNEWVGVWRRGSVSRWMGG